MICGLISTGLTGRPGRKPRFRPVPLGFELVSASPPPAPRVPRRSSRRTLPTPAPRWGRPFCPSPGLFSLSRCSFPSLCLYYGPYWPYSQVRKITYYDEMGQGEISRQRRQWQGFMVFPLGNGEGGDPLGRKKTPVGLTGVGEAYIEEQGVLHLAGRSSGNEGYGVAVGRPGRGIRVHGREGKAVSLYTNGAPKRPAIFVFGLSPTTIQPYAARVRGLP